MFEQIGENELLVIKNTPNRKLNNETTLAHNQLATFCQTYEKRMVQYMEAIPHIPPTLFELQLRHKEIKSDVIKQFRSFNNKYNSKQLVSRLENQIEKIFTNLSKRNLNEYKTCQAGFVIGWKCNVNKPTYKTEPTDDRF